MWQALSQVSHLNGDIIEVGVWRGGSSAILGRRSIVENIDAKLWLCDTFTGVVKSSDRDEYFMGGEVSDTSAKHVSDLMREVGINNYSIIEGIFPDETGNLIETNSIRFCHIDVDTYLSAKDTVDWVWDKMSMGGIIIFDDYGHVQCNGITDYVDEQAKLSDRCVMHNHNGQAWLIKLN